MRITSAIACIALATIAACSKKQDSAVAEPAVPVTAASSAVDAPDGAASAAAAAVAADAVKDAAGKAADAARDVSPQVHYDRAPSPTPTRVGPVAATPGRK